MKWLKKINYRNTSVLMFLMAMLLISSMTLREYAHFIDHAHHFQGKPGAAESSFDHDAKFHYLTEALLAFECHCWHHQLVMVIPAMCENNLSAEPSLLPETRAPPANV